MKKILLCVMALLPQELQGGKRLCTYESSQYLFTLVTRSQSCPYSKTFDTSKNEK